jgi:hypothetical protein
MDESSSGRFQQLLASMTPLLSRESQSKGSNSATDRVTSLFASRWPRKIRPKHAQGRFDKISAILHEWRTTQRNVKGAFRIYPTRSRMSRKAFSFYPARSKNGIPDVKEALFVLIPRDHGCQGSPFRTYPARSRMSRKPFRIYPARSKNGITDVRDEPSSIPPDSWMRQGCPK